MIWCIWKVEKQTKVFTNNVYQPYNLCQVIYLIAQSGAFYTTFVIVTFVVSAIQSNALFLTSNMVYLLFLNKFS